MGPVLRNDSADVDFVMPVMEGDWKLRGYFPFLMSGKWKKRILTTCSASNHPLVAIKTGDNLRSILKQISLRPK